MQWIIKSISYRPAASKHYGFYTCCLFFFSLSYSSCICIFPFSQMFRSCFETLFILSFTLEGQRWPPFERECVLSVAGTCVCACGRCRKKVASRFIRVTLCKPFMYFADRKKNRCIVSFLSPGILLVSAETKL